ncbi:MAG: hypothetical protein HYZ37_02645, partial [Candidatus Solibacter usitatus]|nr:hypothetical protein [Candidatus Solibacter usitatus]
MGRYDVTFKSFAESDPYTLMELFGGIKRSEILKLTPLERELNLSVKVVDHAYLVETAKLRMVVHFESQLKGGKRELLRTLKQEVRIWLKIGLPVAATIVWLSQKHAPKSMPKFVNVDAGALRMQLRIRHFKVWEVPAKSILKLDRPNAWPWVGVSNSTLDDLFQAGLRIRSEVADIAERERLIAELTVLSGVRYNRVEIDDVLGRLDVLINDEVLRASVTVQMYTEKLVEEAREQGVKKGLRKGREEGKADGARLMLRILLEGKIPSLAH